MVYIEGGRIIEGNTYYLFNPGDEHLEEGDPDPQSINWDVWDHEYVWMDGQQKYDICTEETVSNSVYVYVPGEWWDEWDEWDEEKDKLDENGNPTGEKETIPHSEFCKEEFSDYYASFFADSATPRSNHSYIVNVFASSCDLGSDPDEWERRGKLVATHFYSGNETEFNQSVAADDVSQAREKGLIYYAVVAHFALGESAVSNVFTMQGF